MNNMKQIRVGIMQYMQDNDEHYTPCTSCTRGASWSLRHGLRHFVAADFSELREEHSDFSLPRRQG